MFAEKDLSGTLHFRNPGASTEFEDLMQAAATQV
jgi:hypothetical protein